MSGSWRKISKISKVGKGFSMTFLLLSLLLVLVFGATCVLCAIGVEFGLGGKNLDVFVSDLCSSVGINYNMHTLIVLFGAFTLFFFINMVMAALAHKYFRKVLRLATLYSDRCTKPLKKLGICAIVLPIIVATISIVGVGYIGQIVPDYSDVTWLEFSTVGSLVSGILAGFYFGFHFCIGVLSLIISSVSREAKFDGIKVTDEDLSPVAGFDIAASVDSKIDPVFIDDELENSEAKVEVKKSPTKSRVTKRTTGRSTKGKVAIRRTATVARKTTVVSKKGTKK